MLLRPRRGEPRRARRRTASPVSASRVHGFPLRFLPETARRTSARLDDGFMPPGSPKSLAASRGAQWFRTRRAAAGFSAHCRPARTTPCASGRPDSVGRPRSPNLAVLANRAAPLVPAYSPPGTARRPPTSKSANATLPFDLFLDEGCERPERLGGRGPLLDDGRKSSHRLGGCRGELREGQTVTATLAWGCGFEPTFCRAAGSILYTPLAKPGTAFCHEIVRPRSASARQLLKRVEIFRLGNFRTAPRQLDVSRETPARRTGSRLLSCASRHGC